MGIKLREEAESQLKARAAEADIEETLAELRDHLASVDQLEKYEQFYEAARNFTHDHATHAKQEAYTELVKSADVKCAYCFDLTTRAVPAAQCSHFTSSDL